MYKFIVVTDPDSAPGFRLAGVDVLEASSLEEAKKIIPPLIYKDDTGIIPIPSRVKGISRTSYIERLLQRAIGYNIVIRR
jgi:V/A-type H+-transporting ATPase subunit F